MATQYPCGAGTYNNQTGLTSQSDCFPCTGGYYCSAGTINPSMPCAAGYYCRTGATTAAPSQYPDANECPAGYYCEEQTTEPVKCPVGTFSNLTKLMNMSDCNACTQGTFYFCNFKCNNGIAYIFCVVE